MWAPLILGLVTAASVALPSPTPPHVFTATMERSVNEVGSRIVAEGRSPGLSIAVVEDGRIVYARGFGDAQIKQRVRFAPETQSYAGGISESFTAAGVLLLEQDGKLKLGDRVTKYVPELTVAGAATVGQLLSQTSGLPDCTRMPDFPDQMHTMKIDALIAAMNKRKPQTAPGAVFQRNICNGLVAALIIERLTNVPLSDYLQQHIFMPLVMNQSFYAGDIGISEERAFGYTGHVGHFTPARPWDPAWLDGNAGIVTNAYDLAKWDIGMPLLLHVDAVREMYTPADAAGDEKHGLGWVIDQRDGRRYVWQNGEIPGYHAMNATLPDDHIAVIVMANTDSFKSRGLIAPEAVAAQILDIVLPPGSMHVENAVMERAREWLGRLASHQIDRTQLTAAFSSYLTDALVEKEHIAALGKPQTFVPISSVAERNGDTMYEFLVRFSHEQYHYRFTLSKDGKIDGLVLTP